MIQKFIGKVLELYDVSMVNNKLFARAVNKVIRLVFDIFDIIVNVVTCFLPYGKPKSLPPIKSDLIHLSATKLADRIRNKNIRCTDLVETYINRIKDVEPIINGVIQDRFDEAIKEAQAVDKFFANNLNFLGDLALEKPLYGVPVTVKETIAVKGLSNNAARSRISSNIAEEDAEVVKSLRNAGAIPLLVSATPELCLYWETWSAKKGRTCNPYDTRRTAGGSSGGEVALVSSGASVIGIGSDIAGSLRVPSHFCGVYGHKPTPGYVPITGHIPSSDDPMWNHYFTLGPITRYAEDLPLMMKCLIPDKSKIGKLRFDEEVDVSKVKIHYMYRQEDVSILQTVPNVEVVQGIMKAVNSLKDKYGCSVQEILLKEFTNNLYLNSLILEMKGIENVFQKDNEHPDDWGLVRVLELMLKKLTSQSTASVSCLLYGPLKALLDMTPENARLVVRKKANQLQKKMEDVLKTDGVLLYPTFPSEAPYHHRMCSKILDVSYCTIFNILGMPVTQCPVGFTTDGIPVGMQIVAAPHQDRLCMAVARALEKQIGGWKPPHGKSFSK